MKVLGIIAEFNPFHNGHAYLINEAKQLTNADYCIVVMSGNFVQRGEPALMSKFDRAKIALDNGADIVFELPVLSATASAEGFAYGAVSLLNSLNVVTHLAFGSEHTDISLINDIADILIDEPESFKKYIKALCGREMSYPAARVEALVELIPEYKKIAVNEILTSPNSILAIEYIKALKRLSSDIIPVPIKRIGADYNDSESYGNLSSASGIRSFLKSHKDITLCIPANADAVMSEYKNYRGYIFEEDIFSNLIYKLLLHSKDELTDISDSNEFLANKIINSLHNFSSYEEILNALSSKDYTMSRIKRVITHILLDINKRYTPTGTYCDYKSTYAYMLACKNETLLAKLSKKSIIPIISKPSTQIEKLDEFSKTLFELDLRSGNIYEALLASKYNIKMDNEFTKNKFPYKKGRV